MSTESQTLVRIRKLKTWMNRMKMKATIKIVCIAMRRNAFSDRCRT